MSSKQTISSSNLIKRKREQCDDAMRNDKENKDSSGKEQDEYDDNEENIQSSDIDDANDDNINDPIVYQANQSLLQINQNIRRNIIYIDPPWKYTIEPHGNGNNNKMMKGTANSHYSTLPLHQPKQLKIQEIAADDCILLMWTTGPQLQNALELIQSWGFHYKTMFMTWIKTHGGGQVGRGARLGFYIL